MEKKNEINKIEDEVVFYMVMKDYYVLTHRIRFKIFRSLLQHMEKSIGMGSTIWVLMQEMLNSKKC